MSHNIEEFKNTIQSLPLDTRVVMLEALRDSVLDEQPEHTSANIAEHIELTIMEKRYEEYLSGKLTSRSWEEVKEDIRDSL